MQKKVIINLIFLSAYCHFAAIAKTTRFRVMWRDDPATTMVIGWDQVSGSSSTVHYGQRDFGNDYRQYPFSRKPDRVVKGKGMNNHFVRLQNLTPNTVYYFVIRDNEGISRRLSFKTAPGKPSIPLSVIAGGDSRNHRDARIKANRLVSKLRPHCIMFSGDMTESDTPEQWIKWFDDWQQTIAGDGRIFPIIATRGNHEASNETLVKLFDIKSQDIYYALQLGGTLLKIYTLNTSIPTNGAQRIWLANNLGAAQGVTWRFAQYHTTIRPHCSTKKEQNQLIVEWATLFHKYGVQLAVESDAHVVKWTYPIRPSREPGSEEGFIRDDSRGTVYVGEGCWGAPLRTNDDPKAWTRDHGSFNQFKLIFVNQEKVEVRTLRTDLVDQVGEVDPYDVFSFPRGFDKILWRPANGSVIEIRNEHYHGPPLLYREPGNPLPPAGKSSQPGAHLPRFIKPDPASGDVELQYNIRLAAEVNLLLQNEQGREVSRFQIGHHAPGAYRKSINFRRISPGKYVLLILAGNKEVKKFYIDNQ